jgi:hypothetical protein
MEEMAMIIFVMLAVKTAHIVIILIIVVTVTIGKGGTRIILEIVCLAWITTVHIVIGIIFATLVMKDMALMVQSA